MEKLKHIKDCLISVVEEQMADLHEVDTHELGEIIDMIKDIEQAEYYHCEHMKKCDSIQDVEESVQGIMAKATNEEKAVIQQKLVALANKVK